MKNFIKKVGGIVTKGSVKSIIVDGILVTLASWLTIKVLSHIDKKTEKDEKKDRIVINAEVVELNNKDKGQQ